MPSFVLSSPPSLSELRTTVQQLLAFAPVPYTGPVDGILGAGTRAAFESLARGIVAAPPAQPAHDPLTILGHYTGIIDINHANRLDIPLLVAAGFGAIIHKATEGTGFVDPLYAARKAAALEAGLLWGAYHFAAAADGHAQAEAFLRVEDGRDPRTLLCLDFEPSSRGGANMTLQQGRDFIAGIFAHTGRYPMIYGGGGLLRDLLEGRADPIFAHCPLWLCDMRDNPRTILPNWPSWTLLQYTDGQLGPAPHEVPGCDGADRNRFAGTLEQLRAAWPFSGAAAA